MYIKLDQSDYDMIADIIANEDDECKSVYYSDLDILVSFYKNTSYHKDDDYYSGTGAFVTDSVDFQLNELSCGEVELRYSHSQLEKTIIDCLWRY